MSSQLKGAGIAPLGLSPLGFGSPATLSSAAVSPLRNSGSIHGSRKINPLTKDYVIDPVSGAPVGEASVNMLVYLAIATVKGSSAVSDLGSQFNKVKLLTTSVKSELTEVVRSALSSLIARKLVELVLVEVERVPDFNQVIIHVQFKDLTTNTISTISI